MVVLIDLKNQDGLQFNLQLGMLIFSALTFVSLLFIKAHYGRFFDEKKPTIVLSNKLGWMIEETPNIIIVLYYAYNYMQETPQINYIKFFMIFFFFIHYVHRAFIYPFCISNTKKMPIEIALMGCLFCTVNATMQTRSIFLFSEYSVNESIFCFHFFFGIILFFLGMYINIYHDYSIFFQKKAHNIYFVPHGFLFDYVASPNYLGEILEWLGFALMVNTFSAYIFVISSISNLLPRAVQYKNWYLEKFKDQYPKNRNALIPFIL